jgi:hypothetical protein
MSKGKKKARRSGSFVGNGSCDVLCSATSSQLDQDHLTTTMHDRCSSQAVDQANSESMACKMLSNTTLLSQESANPQVSHEQQGKELATPPECCPIQVILSNFTLTHRYKAEDEWRTEHELVLPN